MKTHARDHYQMFIKMYDSNIILGFSVTQRLGPCFNRTLSEDRVTPMSAQCSGQTYTQSSLLRRDHQVSRLYSIHNDITDPSCNGEVLILFTPF